MTNITFFGGACLVALFMCHHAREERDCLRMAALVVLLNWALFAASWCAPIAPALVLDRLGVPAQPEDIWALADLASMIAIMVACRHCWWAPLLWSPYLVALTMHAVAWVNGLDYLDYKGVLDFALIVQLGVLLTMGGGGCADYLRGIGSLVRLRLLGRPPVGNSERAQ